MAQGAVAGIIGIPATTPSRRKRSGRLPQLESEVHRGKFHARRSLASACAHGNRRAGGGAAHRQTSPRHVQPVITAWRLAAPEHARTVEESEQAPWPGFPSGRTPLGRTHRSRNFPRHASGRPGRGRNANHTGRPTGPCGPERRCSPGIGSTRCRTAVTGFTLVELLVVLVLVGLVTALAFPNLERLRGAVTSKTDRDYILDQFAGLGRHAMLQGRAYVVFGIRPRAGRRFLRQYGGNRGRHGAGSAHPAGRGRVPARPPIRDITATSSTCRKAGRSGSTSPSWCTRTGSASAPDSPCTARARRILGSCSTRRTARSRPMRRDMTEGQVREGGQCSVAPDA